VDKEPPMGNVQTISAQHRRLEAPTALRGLQGWLLWRYEPHPNGDKPIKVPYYADGGRRQGANGNPTDRAKLTTFAAARDAAAKRNMDGVGLALMPEFGITATDFDNCVDANGDVPDEIGQIAARTYAEYSPSGKGVRAFSVGNFGNHKAPTTATDYGFETFNHKGFVTFTGNVLPICELLGEEDTVANDPVVNAVIQKLCDARFAPRAPEIDGDFMVGYTPRLGLDPTTMQRILSYLDADMGREPWVSTGMALHHECEGDDTGFDLWDDWSSDGGTYPGTEALRAQWDSFDRRAGSGQRQVTMATCIHMAKKAGYVHSRPAEAALSPESVMAKVDAITSELPHREAHGRFHPEPIYDISQRPAGGYHIKGILPKGELSLLFGASGSGKTFVALSMAFAIARGVDWFGHRVTQGKVVIIAAEGGSGLGKRATAYAKHCGISLKDIADLHVITAAPNFLDQDDISEVIAEIKALGPVEVVQIDTLAQVSPGANENTSEDMGRVIANMKLLHEALGATPQAVHHSGKDASRGSRGWSGIKGATDSQLEILKHEDGQREIHIEKMKDGEDGIRIGFRLEVVTVGVDMDGDEITSCVAVEAELTPKKSEDTGGKTVKRLGGNQRHVMEIVQSQFEGQPSAPYYAFLEACVAALPLPTHGERAAQRFVLRRAIEGLTKGAEPKLAIDNGCVIFCE
jgi:hypothetical protein